MKKLILSISLLLAFSSCDSDKNDNCGTIANDGITDGCYWLEIRNSETGNKRKFCFDQDVWFNAHIGTEFCVTNESIW